MLKNKFKNFNMKVAIITLIILLILSVGIAVSIGSVSIDIVDVYKIIIYKLFGNESLIRNIDTSFIDIVWEIRLPRVLLGVISGAGLALGGVVMQATVQNPLADPYILGISSGGTLGAAFAMLAVSSFNLVGSSSLSINLMSFLGALFASILVFKFSSIGGRITSTKLVLSGVVINLIFSSLTNLLIYFTNDNSAIRSATEWTMGSLVSANFNNILIPFVVVFVCIVFFMTQYRIMNGMLLGDETAITLGIDLSMYRKIYLVIVSILTGVLVSSCGIIGFVGLVIPHITRSLVGTNHKYNIPVAILIGAIFLVWADVLARILIKNMEMPIGIITSLIGAPFFMYIMIKRTYTFGGSN